MDVQQLRIELDHASQRKVINGRFKLLQSIGQGQFGKVLLAEDLAATGNGSAAAKPKAASAPSAHSYVAIKTINRVDTAKLITKTYMSHTTKIKREIQIMKECNHPNVVKLYQVIDDMKFDKILLVLEYCELGEIDWRKYNHYHEKYYKDPARSLPLNRVLRDVTNGLEYLHQYKHIIHRDLKPLNLLISRDRSIKISDFGVSLILENNANDDRELGKSMGTPAFFAPELCQFVNKRLSMFNETDLSASKIDARIDLWSLGVTLYCLFFHVLPFEGFNEFELFQNIVNGTLTFPSTRQSSQAQIADLKELSLLKDLIRRLLSKDPLRRPTLAEIKAHKFTTFDLQLPKDVSAFKNFNAKLADSQAKPLVSGTMSQKLRRLFISRSEEPKEVKPVAPQKINILDLEKVDDLLDSYLDDLSSLGSVEESNEPEVIDAASLLSAMSTTGQPAYPDANLRNSLPGAMVSLGDSKLKDVPPPLKLSNLNFDLPKIKPQDTLGRPSLSSLTRPVVTIGPDSPLSAKSVFSPSRRFFARFKKKHPEPTITALAGKNGKLSDLAPPPAFGDHSWSVPRSRRNLASSTESLGRTSGLRSRKGSVCSSGGFSKISSSGLSLNLHAYLLETPDAECFSDAVVKSSSEDESGSEDENEDANRTMTMDDYLNHLDGQGRRG